MFHHGTEKARSPFDRLRRKFDAADLRCRQCGHVDQEGGWHVTTTGDRVTYRRVCPDCDASDTRELRLA